MLVCVLFLFLYTLDTGHGALHESLGTFPVYAVIFCIGIIRGILSPAIFSMLAQIVPRHIYPNSSAWNSNTWQVAAITGPALGGMIYGYAGVSAAYATAAVSIAISITLFLFIKSRPVIPRVNKEAIHLSILSGLKFVFSNQVILGAITLDLFAVLFGGAVALLPIFASEVLKTGPQGLGWLRAAPAAGAVFMAFSMAYFPLGKNAGKYMLAAVGGFGICMIAFALSRSYALSFGLLLFSGMFDSVSVVIRSTVLQLLTPDEMRGRVSAVNSIFVGSSNELGELESGVTAKFMGTIPSVIFGGCMTLAVVFVSTFLFPKIRKLNMKTLANV
jgi:MFS family permease